MILNLNGLYFELDKIRYYELGDLITQIKGILEENNKHSIDIKWSWDYQGNDIKDTLDGSLAQNYSFEILLVTENLI